MIGKITIISFCVSLSFEYLYIMHKVLSTSELLEKTAKQHKKERISLDEIKTALHERGFGILFIVFSLPLLIPLPLPTGLGTAMSLPIFFFALQLVRNVDSPWLPKWVLSKDMKIKTFRKIVRKSLPALRLMEKISRERLLVVSDNRKFEIVIGIFIMLLNIPIALPFPMSNTLPAVSIIVISFGMLEKDGLMIIVGKIIGIFSWIVCIAIGFALFYGANEVLKYVPETLRDDVKNLKEQYVPEIRNHPGYKGKDSLYKDLLSRDTDY